MKIVVYLAGTGLLAIFGMALGDGNVAACEPRANTDPGRINVAVEPDGYGFSPPCTANVDFYIARNTPLRSIDVVSRVSTREGEVVIAETAGIDLEGTDYGMFAARRGVGPVSDQACRQLSIDVEINECRGEGVEAIECPAIRVKVPSALAGLSVSGDNLNICHDD